MNDAHPYKYLLKTVVKTKTKETNYCINIIMRKRQWDKLIIKSNSYF